MSDDLGIMKRVHDLSAIEVMEIRKARNGYVITAIQQRLGEYSPRGYATYVCSDDPAEVAKTIEKALRDTPISLEAVIQPARQLP